MTALHFVVTALCAVAIGPAIAREHTRPLIPVDPRPPAPGLIFFGGAYVPGPYVFDRREESDALEVVLRDRVIDRLPRTPAVGAAMSPAELYELRERTIAAYQGILARGGAIVLLAGLQITIPGARLRDYLVPTLRALDDRALEPAALRRSLVEIWKDEAIAAELMATYRHDEALWERIRLIESGR